MKRTASFLLATVLVVTVVAGSQAKSRVVRVHAAKASVAASACPIPGCTSCALTGASASKASPAMKRGDCPVSDPSACPSSCPRQARLASR